MRNTPRDTARTLFGLRTCALLPLLLCSLLAFPTHVTGAQTAAVAWSHRPAEEIKWYRVMETGAPLVGTPAGLYALNAETGEPLWRRDDLKGINETETHELTGTPLLLVADNSGGITSRRTKLFALDMLTGETVWETDKLRGSTVDVAPNYEKNLLVFLATVNSSAQKDKPDITALKLDTGELVWQSELTDTVDLYGIERGSKYFPKFDLSGANPPVFDGDSVYFTYAGLHRYNLADGKLVWGTKYGAPGIAGWKKIAMTAITVYLAAGAVARGANATAYDNGRGGDAENKRFVNLMSSYEQYMTKRFTASKSGGLYTYVLTEVKQGEEKGAGIVGVNMMTGQGDRQILFKDKEPDYEIDEASGRVFNFKDKALTAYVVK
ncbi:MAG: hypothetical protein QOE47_2919 [Pyrinomonadaceae bacterium]|nr:hypothetical protein [Pyrinomonadaceae bacterium]